MILILLFLMFVVATTVYHFYYFIKLSILITIGAILAKLDGTYDDIVKEN